MNRWSYCSSDEDEENEEKEKGEKVKEQNEETKIAAHQNQNIALNDTTKNPANDVIENGKITAEGKDAEEDDDYEWEYFYEDVEINANAEKETKGKKEGVKSPVPKRLEGLVKMTGANQIKIGQVVNEGATKITKDNKNALKEQKEPVGPPGKTQKVDPRDGWECPTCTLLNEPKRPGCEACTTERPADYVIPPPGAADTIPRNTKGTDDKPALEENNKNTIKEAPSLKVVAATVTKSGESSNVAGAVGGKVRDIIIKNQRRNQIYLGFNQE